MVAAVVVAAVVVAAVVVAAVVVAAVVVVAQEMVYLLYQSHKSGIVTNYHMNYGD